MLIQLYLQVYHSNWILDFLQYYLLSEFYFIVILLLILCNYCSVLENPLTVLRSVMFFIKLISSLLLSRPFSLNCIALYYTVCGICKSLDFWPTIGND